jgi:hypothetical protein
MMRVFEEDNFEILEMNKEKHTEFENDIAHSLVQMSKEASSVGISFVRKSRKEADEIMAKGGPLVYIFWVSSEDSLAPANLQLGPNGKRYGAIFLNDPKKPADIKHEMMHVLGAQHEHQRPDRSMFIRFPFFKQLLGKVGNRDYKELTMTPNGYCIKTSDYDYLSIMHYPMSLLEAQIKDMKHLQSCVRSEEILQQLEHSSKSIGRVQKLSKGDVEYLQKAFAHVPK